MFCMSIKDTQNYRNQKDQYTKISRIKCQKLLETYHKDPTLSSIFTDYKDSKLPERTFMVN